MVGLILGVAYGCVAVVTFGYYLSYYEGTKDFSLWGSVAAGLLWPAVLLLGFGGFLADLVKR